MSLSGGGLCLTGLCPGGLCPGWGAGSVFVRRGVSVREILHARTVMSRRYVSYWNAFLFKIYVRCI